MTDERRPVTGNRDYNVDYRIIQEIGRGGQGIVYLAEDRLRGRKVALKVLREVGGISTEALGRLSREVEAAVRLDHPGICTVHEAVLDGPAPYIAMRYVEGRSLAQSLASAQHVRDETWIARPGIGSEPVRETPPPGADTDRVPSGPSNRADIDRVIEIIEKAARALHAAHEAKVIHRDVKPSNIMVTLEGDPVILDFGLAHLEESEHVGLTRTGEIWGTPAYLSPEQLVPRARLDRRTDVWSLGVTLYECLTLRRPFDGATNNQIFHAIQAKEPVDPCKLNRALPSDLKVVLDTALEKDRDRRYETALAFAEDLKCVRERRSIAARPVGPVTRFSRWARRNPGVAASLLLAFCLLTAGLAVTVGLLIARDVALREKENALWQKSTALVEKDAALERSEGLRLLAESSAALARDPGLSLLLAIEGARRAPEKSSLVNGAVNEALTELREVRTLVGHVAPVDSAEFSSDGTQVVTASADGSVRVWDVASGKTVASFVHPHVVSARFTPGGKRVVCRGDDNTCRIWGAAALSADPIEETVAHALSADGGLLLALDIARGEAVIRRTETGERVSVIKAPLQDLVAVWFSPDGKRVLGVARNGTATTWSTETGARAEEIADAFPDLRLLRFSPDGRQVAAVTGDRGRIWDIDRGRLIELSQSPRDAHSLTFSPDGRWILTLSRDTVVVWNTATGQARELCGADPGQEMHADTPPPEATFTRDSMRVVGASCDGTAHVWDPESGEEDTILSGHSGDVRFVSVSPDGEIVLTASSDGVVTLWDRVTWTQLAVLRGHAADVRHASFTPDGGRIVTCSTDRTARVWNARASVGAPVFEGHQGPVGDVKFSPDGTRALTASSDGYPRLWDLKTGREAGRLVGKKNLVSPEFSPDGSRIFALCEDGSLALFDSARGALVATLRGDSSFCNAAFSPDGSRIVAASDDAAAYVYDARTGTEIARLTNQHEGSVHSVAFCANGSRIVTASEDHTVKLWDAADWKPVREMPGHGNQPPVLSADGLWIVITLVHGEVRVYDTNGVEIARLPGDGYSRPTISADALRLATECADGNIRVWDLRKGAEIAVLPHDEGGRLHEFSPDGKRVLTATKDGTAQIWDSETGRRLPPIRGQGAPVTDAHFSPDGRWVVISSADETRVFDAANGAEAWVMTRRFGTVKSVRFSPDGAWLLAGYSGGLARLWPSDPLAKARLLKPRELTLKEIEAHAVEDPVALGGIVRLFDEALTNEELVDTLQHRENLSDSLRHAATTAALVRNPVVVAEKLRRRSWAVVSRPGDDPEHYAMALRWIETALKLSPGIEDGLTTLGAARYRAGNLQGALAKLQEAVVKTPGGARSYSRAKNSIFIAMVHARLGEQALARGALAEARRVLGALGRRAPEDVRRLIEEADEMIGSTASQPSR